MIVVTKADLEAAKAWPRLLHVAVCPMTRRRREDRSSCTCDQHPSMDRGWILGHGSLAEMLEVADRYVMAVLGVPVEAKP